MSTIVTANLEGVVVSRVTRRLVPFLFVLYIVAYLDRINVGFAALQMQSQLHFNDAVYGLGAGMFFAGYFFFQVPSNLLLQRIGARRWITGLMVVWGVISSSMVLVNSPLSFYSLRFLLGAAEAGFFPGVIFYLKSWFPAQARARTIAWFMTAAPLSGVVGGPISGALLLHPLGGLAGWQWLFLAEGIPAVILGTVVYYFLTDAPHNARWLPEDEKSWLLANLQREHETLAAAGRDRSLVALRDPRIWLLALVYFGINTVAYGIGLWIPLLIRSVSSVSAFIIGLISAIPYIAAAVAMVIIGHHSDQTGERRWHVALLGFAGAAGLFAAAYTTSVVPLIIALSIAVAAEFSMCPPFWALPSGFLSGAAAALGIGLINSVGAGLGGFFGPYIIGLVRNSTGGFKGGLLVVGGTLAMSGILTLLVKVESGRGSAGED